MFQWINNVDPITSGQELVVKYVAPASVPPTTADNTAIAGKRSHDDDQDTLMFVDYGLPTTVEPAHKHQKT